MDWVWLSGSLGCVNCHTTDGCNQITILKYRFIQWIWFSPPHILICVNLIRSGLPKLDISCMYILPISPLFGIMQDVSPFPPAIVVPNVIDWFSKCSFQLGLLRPSKLKVLSKQLSWNIKDSYLYVIAYTTIWIAGTFNIVGPDAIGNWSISSWITGRCLERLTNTYEITLATNFNSNHGRWAPNLTADSRYLFALLW